jgi:hypothetical protein
MTIGANEDIYYDDGLRRWIEAKAREEHWRLRSWMDVDDLVQDGYICYLRCRRAYTMGPPKPGFQDLRAIDGVLSQDQRKHFMALVQRAFGNHIMSLSSKFASCPEQVLADVIPANAESMELDDLAPAQPEEMSIAMVIAQAPAEIGEAIGKLLQDGLDAYSRSRLRTYNGRVRRGRRALRETTSQRLARVLGDPRMYERVKEYLLFGEDWEGQLDRALSAIFPPASGMSV